MRINRKQIVNYTLSVKFEIDQNPEGTIEDIEKKIREIGKNKLLLHLSGHLFDPEKKIFLENIKIENQ